MIEWRAGRCPHGGRVRLTASERLAGRLASPFRLAQKLHSVARERDEFNAETCTIASGVIRQSHCPKLIPFQIVVRIRERK
jgi:hypothetical protein